MKTLVVTVNLENDAFVNCRGSEPARMLRVVADRIDSEAQCFPFPIRDINGNTVGRVMLKQT